MTSKEALKNIETLSYCKQHITIQEWCNIIEQDLERLEKLEEENEALKMGIESLHTDYKELKETSEFVIEKFKISNKNLTDENEKLKKVIEILKSYDLKVEYVENYYTRPIIRFNHPYNEGIVGITIEEFNFLKEYLE